MLNKPLFKTTYFNITNSLVENTEAALHMSSDKNVF